MLVSAALAAACSTTRVEGTWLDATFSGQKLTGPMLVVGVMRDETVRRVYEDEMAAELAARGIRAIKSYDLVAQSLGERTSAQLMEAARSAGARYALSTAVVGKSDRTVLYSDGGPVFAGAGYGGWYGTYWGAMFPVTTTVRQYEVYAAETAIFDVATDRIQWTARTRSAATSKLHRDVGDFASAIVEAMTKAGLVEPLPAAQRN
jgi:hypothetical protein